MVERKKGSGRPKTARTDENTDSAVDEWRLRLRACVRAMGTWPMTAIMS